MKHYLLDTNTVSHVIREHSALVAHLVSVPIASLRISSITAGELHFGLARRPEAKRLHLAVAEFLQRVDVLPWQISTAECYGDLRATLEAQGIVLAPLDLLIAAHTLATGSVLVSNDKAFRQVPGLDVEDWTV